MYNKKVGKKFREYVHYYLFRKCMVKKKKFLDTEDQIGT